MKVNGEDTYDCLGLEEARAGRLVCLCGYGLCVDDSREWQTEVDELCDVERRTGSTCLMLSGVLKEGADLVAGEYTGLDGVSGWYEMRREEHTGTTSSTPIIVG